MSFKENKMYQRSLIRWIFAVQYIFYKYCFIEKAISHFWFVVSGFSCFETNNLDQKYMYTYLKIFIGKLFEQRGYSSSKSLTLFYVRVVIRIYILGQASISNKNDLQKKILCKKKAPWKIQQKYKGKSVIFFTLKLIWIFILQNPIYTF